MKAMDSDAVRGEFLDYFQEHKHMCIRGGSLVPRNDPTLLFVNSGMAPMKSYFTGEAKPPARELTNVQACIRTKDIDDVGDRHHLTFFEMLGSWSIGGYFKQRAIELAFGLLTDRYGFRPEELFVTVFEGDAALGLPADEESAAAWEAVGIPRDHIVPQPTADNFWGPAGETGPCGPCTEVFLDTGDAFGPAWQPGHEFDTARRYIEIWNAGVFMQFNLGKDKSLRPLPFNSVDTGSGLERVAMALNGLENVYETDLLLPIIRSAQVLFGDSDEILKRHRVIADHLRATCMIMAEGVRPSNEGPGYIPRRLIRRCLTTALQADVANVDFGPVIEGVVSRLGSHYPLLQSERMNLHAGIDEECREFASAVRRGLDRLDSMLNSASVLSGAAAFHLFSTYGLPLEITRDIAADRGIAISTDDYQAEFERHQELSRGGVRHEAEERKTAASLLQGFPATRFEGYETTSGSGVVTALISAVGRVDQAEAGEAVELVVDRTPFYAEGGGQIGDRGTIQGPAGTATVDDTVSLEGGQYMHRATVRNGAIRVGDHVSLEVDAVRRAATAANHTATHLLNAALREVLGQHVHQAGSLVEPERLRFDFTHHAAMTKEQLRQVERLVNTWILDDHNRSVVELPVEQAKASGAISLEGEDYGTDEVRVISFDDVSRELCGGTHTTHTSLIGSMRIRSEQSVAAGVRRITAVTRFAALELAEKEDDTLAAVSSVLKSSPRDVVAAAQRLVAAAGKKPAGRPSVDRTAADRAVSDIDVGNVQLSAGRLGDLDSTELRTTALEFSSQRDRIVIAWSGPEEAARLAIAVPARYRSTVSAADLIRGITGRLGGAGGGSPAFAQGGGFRLRDESLPLDLLAELLP